MRFNIEDPVVYELVRTIVIVLACIALATCAIYYGSPQQPAPRSMNLCKLEATLYCNETYGGAEDYSEIIVAQWINCLSEQQEPCVGLE